MSATSYWNSRHETLSKDALCELQLDKLRTLFEWVEARVFYQAKRLRSAGLSSGSLKSLEDLRRLTPMTRGEWMDAALMEPPFGPFLAAPVEVASRYHITSGTSGRTPIRVLDSAKDWEWISEMWCYAFWGFGVRPQDTVFFAFSYGTFVGFWGAHYACEKLGCLVLAGGNMTTASRVEQIIDAGATVVCSTPTYALRMAQEARAMGIDLANSSVRRLILSGEPAGSIPATKRLIEEQWGAQAADTAGMTELGTIVMFECDHQPGGTHIIEDNFIEEVLDPQTDEPVAYGEQGERVVTSFGRGFIPVIRYRTGDLVVKVPASRCSCGRGFDIYEGGIRGRVDDMRVIRGTNVYPRAVEAIVREFGDVEEFQIRLYTVDGIRDEIELRVEISKEAVDPNSVITELSRLLSQAHEGLRFPVTHATPDSLPRFELKANRLIDEREVIGEAGKAREKAYEHGSSTQPTK
jgi:phenylacetate-CoA ligase